MLRAAVILRGHNRTWRWAKPGLVRTMGSIFGEVHYYVCQWRTRSNGGTSGFGGMDVMHAELVGQEDLPDGIRPDSWTAPSWQAQRCFGAIRGSGIDYDIVVDTRTDIWMCPGRGDLVMPGPGEIHSTRIATPWPGSDLPGMEDHLYAAFPDTYDIWTRRHTLTYDISYNHCILWRYCEDMGLVPRQLGWLDTGFIRPNWVRRTMAADITSVHAANMEWNAMGRDDRWADCEACGIDPEEYSADYHLGPC